MERIVVQKFGGTSLADETRRRLAAGHVEQALAQGQRPVVIVSAMGRAPDPYATDTLLQLISGAAEGEEEDPRDVDLLLSCGEVIAAVVFAGLLRRRGHPARAFTGAQAGIVTDGRFGDARVVRVEPARLYDTLLAGQIPVIAGFQGGFGHHEVTTLGRGGSDTSAAALAVALGAELLEVYTDVDGVMTADPRLTPEAVTLRRATYREIAEMAHLGAKVIHPRAVVIAAGGHVPVAIKQTGSSAPGTMVRKEAESAAWERAADRLVTGIACVVDRAQVTLSPPGGGSQAAAPLFQALGDAGISADMICVLPDRIAFIVEGKSQARVKALLAELDWPYHLVDGLAKVSAVGAGMHGVPGVMAKVAKALQDAGVEILQTSDSHANISCLVREEKVKAAVAALHREFELGILDALK